MSSDIGRIRDALQFIDPNDRDTCTGKTTIGMDLTVTVTTGGRWPDGTRAIAGDVVIWSGENDPADTLIPRLILSSADLSHIYSIADIREGNGQRTTHADFRAGMEARIGKEALEALEADQTPRTWTFDDLKAISATYKAKLKELQANKGVA